MKYPLVTYRWRILTRPQVAHFGCPVTQIKARIGRMSDLGNEIVMELKEYFEKSDDIAMAFLFGSWAKGECGPDSDMDIAIYFNPRAGVLEWENEDAHYESEHSISVEIERIVQSEVDLLVLNMASAIVAESALKGMPIIIKKRSLYLDFLLRITSEAIDFREWIEGYWSLKERRRYGVITRG